MVSKVNLYITRAKTEINTSLLLLKISNNKLLNEFGISDDETFYSGVISHSYYSIFYSAKAMLLTENIETKSPEVHKKTLDEFERVFIKSGRLDNELLKIYRQMIVRAESLIEIFRYEKRKRGDFTYNTIPQANIEPAKESVENAKTFFKHCNSYLLHLECNG